VLKTLGIGHYQRLTRNEIETSKNKKLNKQYF
jgi:hypothetical protein